jgi:hypothetical protein
MTSTLTVQLLPAMRVAPLNEIEPAPGLALIVPPQDEEALAGEATTIAPGDVGKVSSNSTPRRSVELFGFVIVKVSVEVSPALIVPGENDLEMLGGETPT